MLLKPTESVKEDEWLRAVNTSLHPGTDYVLVKHVRLVGMMLIVYVKTAHLEHVSSVGRHRHHGQPRQQGRRQHPVHLPLNQRLHGQLALAQGFVEGGARISDGLSVAHETQGQRPQAGVGCVPSRHEGGRLSEKTKD